MLPTGSQEMVQEETGQKNVPSKLPADIPQLQGPVGLQVLSPQQDQALFGCDEQVAAVCVRCFHCLQEVNPLTGTNGKQRGDQGLCLHISAVAACPHGNSYQRFELYLEKSIFSPVTWVPQLSELNSNVGASEHHELLQKA